MNVLLVIPPMADLNTPYPSTAYLTGYLRSRGIATRQVDWSLELACRLFSRVGLDRLHSAVTATYDSHTGSTQAVESFLKHFEQYRATVESAVRFLQGKDLSIDERIASRQLLPEGPRFATDTPCEAWESTLVGAFGNLGIYDRAKYIASLFLLDISDVVTAIDPLFRLSAYADRLAASQHSFDELLHALSRDDSFVGQFIDEITRDCVGEPLPDLVALSVPFPGNVFGAFRIAKCLRRTHPTVKIALGGGFANTELRSLSDPRVFDFVDFVTLDDGERPLECVLEFLAKERSETELFRTFTKKDGKVVLISSSREADIPFKDTPAPTYTGLCLDRYLSLCSGLSRVHRIWSRHWNKLTLAHGCYWKKCAFCDVSLDYIRNYEPRTAEKIVDHMESIIAETGCTGFHWVDEAAPPSLLGAVSRELLQRNVVTSWWGNVRFDKTFSRELSMLMAGAGCIMVTGGLEVASDRLLQLMQKGVSVKQVARVTRNLSQSGVLVHAYLMYGFPTETLQETVDSLELVRQLFQLGCIHSAFWHRFVATAHSPIGMAPHEYGIRIVEPSDADVPAAGMFAFNDLQFSDPAGTDHDSLGEGLALAVANYREGYGIELDVREWFDGRVPASSLPGNFIRSLLFETEGDAPMANDGRTESAGQSPLVRIVRAADSDAEFRSRIPLATN